MATHGRRNQGARLAAAARRANTPQKKINTQRLTTSFCARANPNALPNFSSSRSNRTLFHCLAKYSPGASPFSINCASQALYAWLPRSPASMRRCQKQGTQRAKEISVKRSQYSRRKRAAATRQDACCSVSIFSFTYACWWWSSVSAQSSTGARGHANPQASETNPQFAMNVKKTTSTAGCRPVSSGGHEAFSAAEWGYWD